MRFFKTEEGKDWKDLSLEDRVEISTYGILVNRKLLLYLFGVVIMIIGEIISRVSEEGSKLDFYLSLLVLLIGFVVVLSSYFIERKEFDELGEKVEKIWGKK